MAFGIREDLYFPTSHFYMIGPGYKTERIWTTSSKKLGTLQTLDPLPIRGSRFRPGTFRVNPVTIMKYTGQSQGGSLNIPIIPGWGEGYSWEGDLAASLATCHCPTYFPVSGSKDNAAANRCVTRAYARMSAPTSDLGMLLAEAKETLAMLANPLGGARKLLMKMMKPKRRNGSLVRNLADQWLEYRYGIMPAVKDAEMLMKLFCKQTSFDANKLFRASATESSYPVTTTSSFSFTPTSYLTGVYATDVVTQMKTTATLFYRRSTNPNYAFGAALTDVPSLMWELVPFSFVVDWVFNVGDYLRSHVINPDCSPLGTSVSFKETKTWRTYIKYLRHNWYPNQYYQTSSEYTEKTETLKRELWISAPMLPSVNREVLNLNRSLDSLSLLWNPVESGIRKWR